MKFFFLILSLLHTALFPTLCSAWTVGFLTGSGGLGDESFNDMTWTGIAKAREECPFSIIYQEWEQELPMDGLLQEMIDEGANLIVLNGDQFIPIIKKYAPLHPEILFIANDFNGGKFPNLKSIVYSQHEGAFLAGALASLHSKSGHVAFVGAIDIPVIESFQVGFIEGVKHISPSTAVSIKHISIFPDYTGFNNPRKGFNIAKSLYDDGVDVIFSVAGMSGNGVIQAARSSNKFVIGVDANQDHMAKGNVLTSVMKRLDLALYRETLLACQKKSSPGIIKYGFKNGGISLTPMTYTRQIVGDENLRILNSLIEDIASGRIIVTDVLNTAP